MFVKLENFVGKRSKMIAFEEVWMVLFLKRNNSTAQDLDDKIMSVLLTGITEISSLDARTIAKTCYKTCQTIVL